MTEPTSKKIERKCAECGGPASRHHGVAGIMEACLASGADCSAPHDHVFHGATPSNTTMNLEAIRRRNEELKVWLRLPRTARRQLPPLEDISDDIDALIAEVRQNQLRDHERAER